MAKWLIKDADVEDDTGEVFDDGQALAIGSEGFTDVIDTVLEGTSLSATWLP